VEIRHSVPSDVDVPVENRQSLPGPSGIQNKQSLPWPSGVKSRKSIRSVRFMPPVMSRGRKILQLSQAAQSKMPVTSRVNESQDSSSVDGGSDTVFYDEISCEEELPWPDGPVVETTETTVVVNDGTEVNFFWIKFSYVYIITKVFVS
jgi:hypothetical protein